MDTQPSNNTPPIKKLPLGKIILSILAIVVVGELIWAGTTLIKKDQPQVPIIDQLAQTVSEPKPAQIILQSSSQILKVGDQIKVDILVDTGGKQTDGTDVILNFDPKTLVVVLASGSANPVIQGTVYNSFPVNVLNQGKVVLSGIASVGTSFSGQGLLGSVTFKAVSVGNTSLAVDFILGRTTDSNIIETSSAKDILTSVKNLDLQISP